MQLKNGQANIYNGLTVAGSTAMRSSGSTVLSIDGISGRLFSVDDSLSGSLFSVNTAAGLPVMEAFSDNSVRIGQYGTQALFVSRSRVGIGKESDINANLDILGTAIVSGSVIGSPAFYVTNGGVQFGSTTGFVWNASNNRLGIGTNAPLDTLHVNGTARVNYIIMPQAFGSFSTGGGITVYADYIYREGYSVSIARTLSLKADAGINFISNNTAATAFIWQENYTTSTLYITYGNNRSVTVGSNLTHTSSIFTIDSTTRGFLAPRMSAVSKSAITSPAQGLLVYDTDSTTEGLWYYSSGSIKSWQRMLSSSGSQVITGSLNVSGITTMVGSGSSLLTIDGVSGRLFQVDDSLSGSLFSVNNSTGLPLIEAFSDDTIRMGQFGTRTLFVSQSRVGIGTETPTTKLDVSGSFRTFFVGTGTDQALTLSGSFTQGGTSYFDFIRVFNSSASAANPRKSFRINGSNGDLEIINSAYSTNIFTLTDAGVLSTPGGGTSDARVKTNIQYINTSTTNTIKQLRPVEFEFKNNIGIKRHGFIAQDVLQVQPDLVLGDGNSPSGTYGLDYDGILALTVKSLQEALSRIEYLEAEIKTLKG